jgi:hypothetical protein
MTQFVSAVYPNEEQANRAVEALVEAKFSHETVSVIKADGNRVEGVAVEHKTWVPRGIAVGSAVGAVAGAVGALLISFGVIPGPMGLIAAGPVFAALQGALAGGIAGTLAGALVGLGYWKEEPAFETAEIEKGAIVVGVTGPEGRVEEAKDVLARTGGMRVRA